MATIISPEGAWLRVVQMPVLEDNYQYLLVCEKTGEAVAVDVPDAPALARELKRTGATLKAVWCTHHHGDHTGGNDELVDRFGVPVFCGAYDFGRERVSRATHGLREGDSVHVGELAFSVLDIPGHTLGHVAFFGHGVVICGDTLFLSGCGRLFEGTPAQMHASLAKLAALDGATLVCCMHEYSLHNLEFALTLEPGNAALRAKFEEVTDKRRAGLATVPSTIAEEKSYNPFLRAFISPEIRDSLRARGYRGMNDPVAAFAAVRELKDAF